MKYSIDMCPKCHEYKIWNGHCNNCGHIMSMPVKPTLSGRTPVTHCDIDLICQYVDRMKAYKYGKDSISR